MHMYPFGAASSARHRPCEPHGVVTHGSEEIDTFAQSDAILGIPFGVEQFVI